MDDPASPVISPAECDERAYRAPELVELGTLRDLTAYDVSVRVP